MNRAHFIQELDNRINTIVDNFEHWPVKDVKKELSEIRHQIWKLEKSDHVCVADEM